MSSAGDEDLYSGLMSQAMSVEIPPEVTEPHPIQETAEIKPATTPPPAPSTANADTMEHDEVGSEIPPLKRPREDTPSSLTSGPSQVLHVTAAALGLGTSDLKPEAKNPVENPTSDDTAACSTKSTAMTAEGALSAIAEALGLGGATPEEVLARFTAHCSGAEAVKTQLLQERRQVLSLHVKIADKASDILELRQQVAMAELASQPSVMQLKTLMCDPAVVREFNTLRDDALRLQSELQTAKDQFHSQTFNQSNKIGHLMTAKVTKLSQENELLGKQLTSKEQQNSQVAMMGHFTERLQTAYCQLDAHASAMDLEAEDLYAHIASLQKSKSKEAAYTFSTAVPSKPAHPRDNSYNTGSSDRSHHVYPKAPGPRDRPPFEGDRSHFDRSERSRQSGPTRPMAGREQLRDGHRDQAREQRGEKRLYPDRDGGQMMYPRDRALPAPPRR